MQTENHWTSLLREKMIKVLEESNGPTWGYGLQDNWAFVSDLVAMAGMPGYNLLEIKERTVHAQGIEIRVIPREGLTSLQEISNAVYDLLYAEREKLFIILPIHDEKVLSYWFVTGAASHGHIGTIVIQRADIPYIDLSMLDDGMS